MGSLAGRLTTGGAFSVIPRVRTRMRNARAITVISPPSAKRLVAPDYFGTTVWSPPVVPGGRIIGMAPCDGGVGTRIAGSTAGGCNVPFCRESLSLRVVLPDVPPARPPGVICSGGGCDALGGATCGGASCGGAA